MVEPCVIMVEYPTLLRHIPPHDLQRVNYHNVYGSSGTDIFSTRGSVTILLQFSFVTISNVHHYFSFLGPDYNN